MRRRGAVLLAVGLAAMLGLASAASAQDGGAAKQHHWPRRVVYFPVRVDLIEQSDYKPSHLQLYSSFNRGPWQASTKLPLSGLEDLGDGKKGFKFTADRDGEYEFSVQYWYADGSSSPKRADELAPMLSVVIDTTPPVVRLSPLGNGVEWSASDDNLDPRYVTLEAKFPSWTKWQTVAGWDDDKKKAAGRQLQTADSYAWKLRPGEELEVRVKARDRAGNEGYSPVVRVPGDTARPTTLPRDPGGTRDWPPGLGSRDPIEPRSTLPPPRIEYVNSPSITVDYAIQRMGRSGIKAARLFVLNDRLASGWQLAEEFKVNLMPSDRDQNLSLKYAAKDDGVYGFYVAPESGAGVKADPPRKDEPPMMYVVVDTDAPYVKITGVRVSPGGVRGPLVEITWEAADQNLLASPVSLEYSLDKNAVQWNEIKYRLENNLTKTTGRYVWEVPNEELWKFHVRIRATDKAANTGTFIWPEEVIVDLEKPAAGITGVHGAKTGGEAPSSSADPIRPPAKKPSAPKSPAPSPKPPAPTPKSPSESAGPKLPARPQIETPMLPELPK